MKIEQIWSINFQSNKKSQRLDRVLTEKKIGNKIFDISDVFIKNIIKNEQIASTPIIDFIGKGSSACAIETEDGKVLKLSHGNHYPLFRPIEDFDVPIYKKGKVGEIYYYFEEKLLQHGMNNGFVKIMKQKIKEKGYSSNDLGNDDVHQIGISKSGTLYLIDPECAKFKTIFHALWKKFKTLIPNKLSFSHFSKALHK